MDYRIRKSWEDIKSQLGSFETLEEAKENCPNEYKVFSSYGELVWEPIQQNYIAAAPLDEKEQIIKEQPIDKTEKVLCKSFTTKWSEEKENCCGEKGKQIRKISLKTTENQLFYRVHLLGGGWLTWNDSLLNSEAGFKDKRIDAIEIQSQDCKIRYRVSMSKGLMQDWITDGDFAGIFGNPIQQLQIEILEG